MTEKTELKKTLSPINVCALALGCIIGWGAFVMPGNIFLPNAGPLGTAIEMMVASLAMIIIANNYSYMVKKFPVAGGEFVYANEAFGKKHAFLCSWFLGLSYLAIVPLNATALALIGRNLLGDLFRVGFLYCVYGYDIYSGELLLAVVSLVFFAYLSVRGCNFVGVFNTALVLMLVGGICLVVGAIVVDDGITWKNINPYWYPNTNNLMGIMAIIAIAPWAFVGFDTVPQAAEEFQFSPNNTKLIMVISILFGASVYVALTMITAMVIPYGYVNWVQYIDDVKNLNGLMALPTFNAAYILLGDIGLVFLGASVTSAILSGIIGFYMATSRLFYSMAKENILPKWFANLNEKYGTPDNSIVFVMIISIIAPFFGRTALGYIVDMASIGAAIGYGYTSLAALKYALIEGNVEIIVTGILGTIMSVIFFSLLLVPIPLFNCSLGIESWFCLILWCLLGYYFYSNKY